MGKDQLLCANIEDLVSSWDLFIAKRSALRRASRWLLKQIITLSGSQDIGDLVSDNLVITD